jgi:hypothetical protein
MKFKPIIAGLLVTILLSQGLSFGDYSSTFYAEAQSSDYLVYDDPISSAISLEYPSDWTFVQSEFPGLKMVTFTSPVQNLNESPEMMALLLTIMLNAPIDLFDLSQMVSQEMQTSFGLQNFKIIEEYETVLDKTPAGKMKFSGMFEPDISIVGTATWSIVDNRAYIFYFISEPENFPKNSSVGKSMEESIKFQEPPKVIVGKYSDPDLGITAEFPDNWITLEYSKEMELVGTTKSVNSIAPEYSQSMDMNDFVIMQLISMDASLKNSEEIMKSIDESGCQIPNEAKTIEFNNMKASEMETNCVPGMEAPMKSIMYIFFTKEKMITLQYGAFSDVTFEKNISEFEKLKNSLQIDRTLNLSDPYEMAEVFDYTVNKHPIQVNGKNVELLISSDAQITEVGFDDENQELAISANSPVGVLANVEITAVDNLIGKPYTIRISEVETDNYIIQEDLTINEHSISVTFEGSQEIQIKGKLNEDQKDNEANQIPEWIRNNAGWWAQGAIGDSDFTSGIQFLIKEGIITIPETSAASEPTGDQEIPSWIKNNADWWSQGLISDDDFVKGIQFLVEQGIIQV